MKNEVKEIMIKFIVREKNKIPIKNYLCISGNCK